MENEIWKDIEGFEGYQVSTLGRVKSLGNGNSNNSKEKILKQYKNKKGYLFVNLYKDGKAKMFTIHRLVAKAFIPNPLNLPCVNHKTEDKSINYVWCIEWCTQKYNVNYGTRNERISKKLSKKVLCVETGIIYPSIIEVERQTRIAYQNISACCNGKPKHKTAGGFHWQYIE